MTKQQLIATLFCQAAWLYLLGNYNDASESLMQALMVNYGGCPFPSQETLQ